MRKECLMSAKRKWRGCVAKRADSTCRTLAFCLLATASAIRAGAEAEWFAGHGDISDVSRWSQEPRKLVENPDGTVTTNSVWCRFRTAGDGAKNYAVTLSRDLRIEALGWLGKDSDLVVRLDLAPYALSFSYSDSVRMMGSPALRLESGTLSTLKLDGGYGSVVFWEGASNATFVVDGPDAVLDGGVNVRGGDFCAVEVLNGGRVTRGVNLHGFSNNRLLVSGQGSLVDFAGEDFNVGGWHKQNEVINGTGFVTNNVARIAAGGVVTNVRNVICGNYGSHGLLDVDGGTLFATGDFIIGRTEYSHGNTVRIANGARVVLPEGKRIAVGATTNSEKFGCGQTLLFENYRNDRKEMAGFNIGTAYDWEADYGAASSNHTVKIVNSIIDIPVDGRFSTYGGANNGIVVAAGSKVSVGLDDEGNLVEGGNGITIGGGNSSHGNYLIVTGEGSVVSNFNKNCGTRLSSRNARGTLIEASDGGVFYGRAGMNVGTEEAFPDGGGATVRAVRGGRIAVQTLSLGKKISSGGQMASNRVESVDGGFVEVELLRFWGQGNTVFLSNGVVRVTNEFYTNFRDEEDCGRNTTLVFAGETPRFEMAGNHHAVNCAAVFRYEIPVGGYRTIPYERTAANSKIALKDDTRIELAGDGFLRKGGRTALMKAPGGVSVEHRETVVSETSGDDGTTAMTSRVVTTDVTATKLAEWNKNVPKGCALYLSNDAETLAPSKDGTGAILAFRAPKWGFHVIFR